MIFKLKSENYKMIIASLYTIYLFCIIIIFF